MDLEKLTERARGIIERDTGLGKPLAEVLGDQAHREFGWSGDSSRETGLGEVGALRFGGEVAAAVHLTRTDVPPLDGFEGEPGEDRFVFTSLELDGSAGASAGGTVAAGVAFGIEAGLRARYAHHVRHPAGATVGDALAGFLDGPRHPYDPDGVAGIREHEVLEVEFGGSAAVSLSAGWKHGLARSISDVDGFDGLDVDGDLAFRLDATLAATFRAGLGGRMKVVVSRSRSRDGHVRVRLFKESAAFVGAGIELNAGVQLLDPGRWADEVLEKALELPDRLISEVRELDGDLGEILGRLDALGDDARARLERDIDATLDALGVDGLADLVDRRDDLPAIVREVLDPLFFERAARALERLGEARQDFAERVDRAFADVARPLADLRKKLSGWIGRYDRFRQRLDAVLTERVGHGLSAEISAGINRTRATEALLDLDFHLASPGDDRVSGQIRSAYHAAVLGDFNEALMLANVLGSHGVEINGGSLEKTVKVERTLGIKLNLFGAVFVHKATSWSGLTVEDGLDGSIGLVGKAAAKRYTQWKEAVETVSFLFDLHGAARREHGREYFDNVDVAASFERTLRITEVPEMRALIPLHLEGAHELGLVDLAHKETLVATLLDADGDYEYGLGLEFPRDAVGKLFLLDTPDAGPKSVRATIWGAFRSSLRKLDVILPSDPDRPCPMSALVDDRRIAEITEAPQTRFTGVVSQARGLGYRVFRAAELPFWNAMKEMHYFIGVLLAARARLVDDAPARKLLASLRRFGGSVRRRSAGRRAVDAKYLMLAELAGLGADRIRLTLARGETRITL